MRGDHGRRSVDRDDDTEKNCHSPRNDWNRLNLHFTLLAHLKPEAPAC
jgi:hypothetical protein